MMKKSGQWRSTPDRITATSIIQGIGPQKYVRRLSEEWIGLLHLDLIWPVLGTTLRCLGGGEAIKRKTRCRFSTSESGSDLRSLFVAEPDPGLQSFSGTSAVASAPVCRALLMASRAGCADGRFLDFHEISISSAESAWRDDTAAVRFTSTFEQLCFGMRDPMWPPFR